jgi:hypothetical protein
LPTTGFGDAITNECDEQRRCSADRKHGAPPVPGADEVIYNRCQKDAEVISGVHQRGAHLSPIFRPLFRDEGSTHRPLAADANSG